MNIQIKTIFSPEFIDIIAQAKSKRAIKNNMLIKIAYKRSDIRFYGKLPQIDPEMRTNIVCRKLDEIKELKQQFKQL